MSVGGIVLIVFLGLLFFCMRFPGEDRRVGGLMTGETSEPPKPPPEPKFPKIMNFEVLDAESLRCKCGCCE